jgi:hypothetical protein
MSIELPKKAPVSEAAAMESLRRYSELYPRSLSNRASQVYGEESAGTLDTDSNLSLLGLNIAESAKASRDGYTVEKVALLQAMINDAESPELQRELDRIRTELLDNVERDIRRLFGLE